MLCSCANSLAKALSALGPVGLNANLSGSMAAGLNANAGLVAAANAAVAANANLAANASANLAAAASVGANVNAMASLSALATFCMNMKGGFGIDMGASAAPGELSDLLESLLNNAWNKGLAKLPLNATPNIQGLADIASAIPAGLALGVNILGPNAQLNLNAAATAAAKANAAASAKAAASLGLSATAAANLSAQLTAAASANASLKAAFGASLGFGIDAGGLGESLKSVTANMASLPNFGQAITEEIIKKLLKLLKALDAIKKGLDVDLTIPGANKNLDKAISEVREKTAESLFEKSKSIDESKSLSKDASQSLSEQQDMSESLDFAKSKEFNKIFGKGVPGVPNLANLLAVLANRLISETGTPMTERSPCGPQCLFMPFLPPQCLCPKVKMELPKLPPLSFKPQLSASTTSSISSSPTVTTAANASSAVTATGTAAGSGAMSAQGSAAANAAAATQASASANASSGANSNASALSQSKKST